jgi:uncharacterized membrane protein YgcG
MTRLRWMLALPALLIATSGPLMAAEIKDTAGMFSAEALKKARTDLDRVERDYKVPVTIETVESLNGKSIDKVLPQHARAADARGLFVLIAKKEHTTEADAYKTYSKFLTGPRLIAIRDSFTSDFKKGNFDAGLATAIDKIDSVLAEAKADAGGVLKPSTPAPQGRRAGQAPVAVKTSSGGLSVLLYIGLGILALFLVIRVLGAIFSGGNRGYAGQNRMMGPGGGGMGGPGYGQPGYGGGGGGGGFMQSMLGGIGGALAGNWLYDQFSGRHHDNSMTQSNYDPASGAAVPEEAGGPDWVGPADGGADWGGGGGDAGGGGDWGGGGGDAGGGGGGDWGGGGGGGDWGGGGGGGDWGGGGGGDGGGW